MRSPLRGNAAGVFFFFRTIILPELGMDEVYRRFVHPVIRDAELVRRRLVIGPEAQLFANIPDDIELLAGAVEERDVEVRAGDL